MGEATVYIVGFLIVSFGFVTFFGAPYVPTLKRDRRDVLKIYNFTKNDVFVDIGSGDGTMLRMAAGQKVKAAIGYELSPWMYVISRLLSRHDKRIAIRLSNFWRIDLPDNTTVVYTFLNGRFMPRLKKKLETHVKRTNCPLYFISYGFKMPGMKPLKHMGAMSLYKFETLQT